VCKTPNNYLQIATPLLSPPFAVLKRLSSKKVLQPHAGATLRFTPHSASKADQQQQQETSEHEFQTDLLMLVAGNSRQMGRTVAVCPDALLDDGLLDFTVLSGSSLASQVQFSWHTLDEVQGFGFFVTYLGGVLMGFWTMACWTSLCCLVAHWLQFSWHTLDGVLGFGFFVTYLGGVLMGFWTMACWT
jgi:hypothetical protein